MLAVPWPAPFVDVRWSHEIKWDGVRTLLAVDGNSVRLTSRRGIDATSRYPELTGFRAARPMVLDGEIVALDDAGRPSFERLQQRMNLRSLRLVEAARSSVPITYVVFDVLHDDVPVIDLPLYQRRRHLDALDLAPPLVRSHSVDGDPADLWRFVNERGIEGIVAKRLDSPYRPGTRSPEWRKIGVFHSARTVVGGFTPGEGGRAGSFGALLVGLWTPTGLRWVGAVGSGFTDEGLRAIRGALGEMSTGQSPFLPDPEIPRRATWVEPQLVAMVQYKEWTTAGRLRAPSFRGFTDDAIGDVTWEREGPPATPV